MCKFTKYKQPKRLKNLFCKDCFTYLKELAGNIDFESWINSISFVRNICAHYGRLYNVKLVKQPMLYKEYKEVSNYRIFAVILCMKHIIKNEMVWLTFKNDLLSLIDKYSTSINLEYISFVDGWENLV